MRFFSLRKPNTNSSGSGFDDSVVQAVWSKASPVLGRDPAYWRKDDCGALMYRYDYGKTITYGWEIDHIRPIAKQGSDALSNLQPLQWQNNRKKSDNYPYWSCAVTFKAS